MQNRDIPKPTKQDLYEIYKRLGGTKPLEELKHTEISPLAIMWYYERIEKEQKCLEPISYYHNHYCEEKIFCDNKKKFNCKYRVKYKKAGHHDKCDFCDRMITAYFDETKDYNKVLFVNRISEFFTKSEYDAMIKHHERIKNEQTASED